MSYIQGTVVKLQADFVDNETKLATEPAEVVLTIRDPAGTLTELRLSNDEIVDDPVIGRFYYYLDTTPMTGTWQYQFESTGSEATVGRKEITVNARLSA
jgi:hypothetical protein